MPYSQSKGLLRALRTKISSEKFRECSDSNPGLREFCPINVFLNMVGRKDKQQNVF